MKRSDADIWKQSKSDIFWTEIAPCDHIVQIYESDSIFLDALSGFVTGGINAGECVVIIATQAHITALESRLAAYGKNVAELISQGLYIPYDAKQTLDKFMVGLWPDADLFNNTVSEILSKAQNNGKRVRAFGEMVAMLWGEGQCGATIHLEHLWNMFCEKASFSLFCAYPKSGFTQDMNTSISHICSIHSKEINGVEYIPGEIQYKASIAH